MKHSVFICSLKERFELILIPRSVDEVTECNILLFITYWPVLGSRVPVTQGIKVGIEKSPWSGLPDNEMWMILRSLVTQYQHVTDRQPDTDALCTAGYKVIQEAQLSQIGRARCFASLNISLRHSRSLKVIRNDTVESDIY